MKTYRYTYIFLMALFSAIAVSCEVDEVTDAPAADALVHKVFHATIEEDGLTKTMLDETAVDGVRGMLWDPGDVIGIGIQGSTFRKFTNVVAEPTANGVFEGDINEENTYYAIYPWQENKTMTTELTVEIPSRQTYRANSFDINMAPMVGKGNNGESIHFQNLCGILAVSMKGTDVIKSISLTAKDVKGNKALISGQFTVDMGYETFPYPMPTEQSLTNVTIDCGEGVQLDSEKETYFHILLPPGTYYGLELLITTSDARFMTLSTDKTLAVKRSVLTKTSSLEFMENVGEELITDLSLRGNSNCYIVPSEGIYSFDATVIGNGKFGIISGAGFHTDTPEITPVSVELLWEDKAGLIKGYGYDPSKGRVELIVSDLEGNALIAAKDANGTILWSWHIWVTDTPVDQKYVNSAGTFTVQDRNLGATRADRGTGEEWKDAKGILYEWGRKDPFVFDGDGKHLGTRNSNRVTIDKAIADPMMFAGDYWGWETTQTNTSLWLPDRKTIYDPCPVGYKVIKKEVWQDFSTTNQDVTNNTSEFNVSGAHNNGWDFYYDGINTTYIPATDIINYYYEFTHRDNIADLWSSNATQGTNAYRWNYEYWDESRCRIQMWYSEITSHAMATRCMKDEGHVDIALPVVEIIETKDATAESVILTFNVVDAGASEVTESGIIYGTSPGLSMENGHKVVASNSKYEVNLSGLTEGTRYYAVVYATNSFGTSYSKEISFYTKFTNYTNLSQKGTSNCYIVSPIYGAYAFDCKVKGNSTESVGIPASAEVLWETKNTDALVEVGEIVQNVTYEDGFVYFETVDAPGNALIAVKDSGGNVLWSWHIWLTEYPESHVYYYYDSDLKIYTEEVVCVMQDRNLGALSTDLQSITSRGLLYQWGRKDPFVSSGSLDHDVEASITTKWPQKVSVDDISDHKSFVVSNPMTYITSNSNLKCWFNTSRLNEYVTLWNPDTDGKGIFDPCPLGWRVPGYAKDSTIDVLTQSGFYSNNRTETDMGYVFVNNNTSIGYPYSAFRHTDGELWHINSFYYWARPKASYISNACSFHADVFGANNISWACPVRCMKE